MKIANSSLIDRAADLHYAYQFGQDAANGDLTAKPEFDKKFAGDVEAKSEFNRGFAEQLVGASAN
jgi:hypothetical protein